METKCEWRDCEVLTNKRFCRQACREKWQYHCTDWKAKKLARNKEYATTHPEVIARAQKKWYENGGKAIRDAWREANRERYRELINEWRRNNYDPAANAAACSARRAKLAERGAFSKEEWLDLCEKYDYKCINCGAPEQHADHVVPLSQGGVNTIDNIQPLCRPCNSRKGTNTIDYRIQ